ncbi:diguanylate cyclase (GGDEF) domain-containing protein [Butyrivibrio proteoclasticus]|uniref:Diguanylate cyclase (GGDEF) domain-containing protein n=1 Tax=Butyrivibrio proteoclasticus TaxID=43305 RepID=A0A1I5R1K3_9FIRM|nr:GGDEF domain-containing protein [Butyrivibrio proteoclasticus]SFP51936.1 diguanylate cyclase (GGDEF) domain-containing protein [Butyrivibrio proteoclasticus]
MASDNAGIAIVDEELNIIDTDFAFSDYVSDPDQKSFLANVYPDDQHLLYEIVEHLASINSETLCFRVFGKNFNLFWVIANCKRADSNPKNISISIKDVETLNGGNNWSIDYGTGLLDKQAIIDYAKSRMVEGNNGFSLCIMDIDNFKKINDTMGHSFGDKILLEVGKIVLDVLKNDGKAGRIGGDEIMLVINGKSDSNGLRSYLKSIRERVEQMRVDKDGYPLVTVSIGTGNYPKDVDSYDKLFNLADKMLYRAKNRGKNRYVMYNSEVHGAIIDGELDTIGGIVSEAKPQDKTKLVLGVLDGFFGLSNKTIVTSFMQIVATYEIDEGYIFFKNLKESYMGFSRKFDKNSENDKRLGVIVESTSDLEYVTDRIFDEKFDDNGVFVVDTPENQLKSTPALEFFRENSIKHAFFYKMNEKYQKGYVVLYNTRNNSRKIPQSDITDFTYLGKMIEIALKSR